MPEPPGWINEFAFIKSFWFNKCHHPWTLYVDMTFPPTVGAAQKLLALDLPQIARTLFRPGGPRTKRHGRKRPPLTKKPFTKVPDPNESVAALIRNVTEVGERVVEDGPRGLWNILDLGESVIGKFFIVGLIESWLYDYAVFIDAAAASDCGLPAVRAEGAGTFTGNPGFALVGGADAIWTTGGADCFDGSVFMPADNWMGSCSGKVKNIGNGFGDAGPVVIGLCLRDETGHVRHGSGTFKTLAYNEEAELSSMNFFNNGEAIGCVWWMLQIGSPGVQTHFGPGTIFCQAY